MCLLLCASGCDTLAAPADDADTDPGSGGPRGAKLDAGVSSGIAGAGSSALDASREAQPSEPAAGVTTAPPSTAGSAAPSVPDMCTSTEAMRFSAECVFLLSVPLTPDHECQSEVRVNGIPVQCDDANGWSMIKPDLIQLNGRACQAALSSDARVVVTSPCSGAIGDGDPEPADAGAESGKPTVIGTGANVGPMMCGTVGVTRVGGSCDFQLSQTIERGTECTGIVTLNGQPLPCNDSNGWVLSMPERIRLLGSACQAAMDSVTALVQAQFPCGVQ
jgi:hypothetical protein